MTRNLLLVTLVLSLGACSDSEPEKTETTAGDTAQQPAPTSQVEQERQQPEAFTEAEVARAMEEIDAEELHAHVKTLSSDEFGGRAPFTEGERKTLEYLERKFREIGVEPGNGESFRQAVNLVELTSESTPLTLSVGDQSWTLEYGENMMAWTTQVTEQVGIDGSQMVFVGYGIVAPEYDWNDYEGLDVAGKTVVIVVNDPGYATRDNDLFNGLAMTYYGRWTYKFEEAARQGAAGAFVIHETGAAGYPWEVVSGSWSGAQFHLASENDNMDRVKVEGWLSEQAARDLFEAAGQDFDAAMKKAAESDFEPVPLGATATVAIDNTIRRDQSFNVVARIPGVERPDEHFVYMAHWDHMGTMAEGEGDLIYNGAVDNATGTAALLELAEAFKALPRNPRRSILLMAVTAEESGLLGSAHYAANPIYPLDKTVGGINIDSMNVTGPTNDVVVIGYGSSELENYLADAAGRQGRKLMPEPTPEKGFFYRSDHFNFAKRGVPVLYAEAGIDDRERGSEFGREAQADYVANRYHKPSDEYDPEWNLGGAVEDIELYFRVGLKVADSDAWPNWFEGTEFRAIRDEQMEGRGAGGADDATR